MTISLAATGRIGGSVANPAIESPMTKATAQPDPPGKPFTFNSEWLAISSCVSEDDDSTSIVHKNLTPFYTKYWTRITVSDRFEGTPNVLQCFLVLAFRPHRAEQRIFFALNLALDLCEC